MPGIVTALSATVLAAVAPAVLIGLVLRTPLVVPIAFVFALPHAVLGLLIFLLLRRYWRLTIWSSALAGFLIGALPLSLWTLSLAPGSTWVNGFPTVVDGKRTLAGWLEHFKQAGMLGLCGAFGGLTFWLFVRSLRNRIDTNRPKSINWRHMAYAPALATAFVLGILAIPTAMRDRSCHNSLRDGRSSIGPEIAFNVPNDPTNWDDLVSILEEFGRSHGWSVRKRVQNSPDSLMVLDVSVCEESGTNIMVVDVISPLESPSEWQPLTILVYQPQGGDSWRSPTADLVARLSAHWPMDLWFSGERGERIPAPDWIAPSSSQISGE